MIETVKNPEPKTKDELVQALEKKFPNAIESEIGPVVDWATNLAKAGKGKGFFEKVLADAEETGNEGRIRGAEIALECYNLITEKNEADVQQAIKQVQPTEEDPFKDMEVPNEPVRTKADEILGKLSELCEAGRITLDEYKESAKEIRQIQDDFSKEKITKEYYESLLNAREMFANAKEMLALSKDWFETGKITKEEYEKITKQSQHVLQFAYEESVTCEAILEPIDEPVNPIKVRRTLTPEIEKTVECNGCGLIIDVEERLDDCPICGEELPKAKDDELNTSEQEIQRLMNVVRTIEPNADVLGGLCECGSCGALNEKKNTHCAVCEYELPKGEEQTPVEQSREELSEKNARVAHAIVSGSRAEAQFFKRVGEFKEAIIGDVTVAKLLGNEMQPGESPRYVARWNDYEFRFGGDEAHSMAKLEGQKVSAILFMGLDRSEFTQSGIVGHAFLGNVYLFENSSFETRVTIVPGSVGQVPKPEIGKLSDTEHVLKANIGDVLHIIERDYGTTFESVDVREDLFPRPSTVGKSESSEVQVEESHRIFRRIALPNEGEKESERTLEEITPDSPEYKTLMKQYAEIEKKAETMGNEVTAAHEHMSNLIAPEREKLGIYARDEFFTPRLDD